MIIAIQLLVLSRLEDQTIPCHFRVHFQIHFYAQMKEICFSDIFLTGMDTLRFVGDEIFS